MAIPQDLKIDLGTGANTQTGDPLRIAYGKSNAADEYLDQNKQNVLGYTPQNEATAYRYLGQTSDFEATFQNISVSGYYRFRMENGVAPPDNAPEGFVSTTGGGQAYGTMKVYILGGSIKKAEITDGAGNIFTRHGSGGWKKNSATFNGMPVLLVETVPTEGEENTLYAERTTLSLKVWNGTDYDLYGGAEITYQAVVDALGYTPEPDLGNPVSNGMILSSDSSGNRSWITAPDGTGTGVSQQYVDDADAANLTSANNYTNSQLTGKEDVANKAVDFSTISHMRYPSVQAVVSYINAQNFITGYTVTEADVLTALGYTPENITNKAINFTTSNDTLYPTVKAVVDYIAAQGYITSYTVTEQDVTNALGFAPISEVLDSEGNSVVTGGVAQLPENTYGSELITQEIEGIQYPLKGTLDFHTDKIINNSEYSSWPQGKCFTYNGNFYLLYNEGSEHASSDLIPKYRVSKDGGVTYSEPKIVYSTNGYFPVGQNIWSAGVKGNTFYAVYRTRGYTYDVGVTTHYLIYGEMQENGDLPAMGDMTVKEITGNKSGTVVLQYYSFAALPDGSIVIGYTYPDGEVGIAKTSDDGDTWEYHIIYTSAEMGGVLTLVEPDLHYDATTDLLLVNLRSESNDVNPEFLYSNDYGVTFTASEIPFPATFAKRWCPLPIVEIDGYIYSLAIERRDSNNILLLKGKLSELISEGGSAFSFIHIGNAEHYNDISGTGVPSGFAYKGKLIWYYASEEKQINRPNIYSLTIDLNKSVNVHKPDDFKDIPLQLGNRNLVSLNFYDTVSGFRHTPGKLLDQDNRYFLSGGSSTTDPKSIIKETAIYSMTFWYKVENYASGDKISVEINDGLIGQFDISQNTDWKRVQLSRELYVGINEYGFLDISGVFNADITISDVVLIRSDIPSEDYFPAPEDTHLKGKEISVGGDNGDWNKTSDNKVKSGFITLPHFLGELQKRFVAFFNVSTSTENKVSIGGGSSSYRAATKISFYTAPNNTTDTGTEKLTLTEDALKSAVPVKVPDAEAPDDAVNLRQIQGVNKEDFVLPILDTTSLNLRIETLNYSGWKVNWGDGSEGIASSGEILTHTYSASFSGNVTITGFNKITLLSITTGNVSFDIAAFSTLKKIREIVIIGNNETFGDIADLPAGLIKFVSYGSNTISGDIGELPTSLEDFRVLGNNTISGNIAELPLRLKVFSCGGENTTNGNIGYLPNYLIDYSNLGLNSTSGDIVDLPQTLEYYRNLGSNTALGNIAELPPLISFFETGGLSDINKYTYPSRWSKRLRTIISLPETTGLTSAEVDNLLIDVSKTDWYVYASELVINLSGINEARTSLSDQVVLDLEAKGVTVMTN